MFCARTRGSRICCAAWDGLREKGLASAAACEVDEARHVGSPAAADLMNHGVAVGQGGAEAVERVRRHRSPLCAGERSAAGQLPGDQKRWVYPAKTKILARLPPPFTFTTRSRRFALRSACTLTGTFNVKVLDPRVRSSPGSMNVL